MTLDEIRAHGDALRTIVDVCSDALNQFPKGAMGLVSDAVRSTPEYRKADANYKLAFARLREFNATLDNATKRKLAKIRRGR